MLRDWQEFFKKLPIDVQKELDSLAKYKTEDKKRITKEIHAIIETDTRITTDSDEEVKIRQAWGYYLSHRFAEKKRRVKQPTIEQVTPVSNKEKINELLKDPNLFDRIVTAIQIKRRVVGEEKSIKITFLLGISPYCINIHPTSTNLHPDDLSGAGKDYVVEAVGMFLDESGIIKYIHIVNPSNKALTYLDDPATEEDDIGITLKSFLHIEDAESSFVNNSDFKSYLSGNDNTLRVDKNLKSKLHGTPKVPTSVTSCDTETSKQLHRRLPSFGLNTSDDQTDAIIVIQGDDAELLPQEIINEEDQKEIQLILDSLKMLEDVYVLIPKEIKDDIKQSFGDKPTIIARTLHKTFQDYVKMSAILYQFQRDESEKKAIVDGKECKTLLANETDFNIAKSAFETLYEDFGEKLLPLNKRQRAILEKLKECAGTSKDIYDVVQWEFHDASYGTIRNDLDMISKHTPVIYRKYKGKWYCMYPRTMKVEEEPANQKSKS